MWLTRISIKNPYFATVMMLAISNSEGAEVRKPMAYAIIGGMTTSTLLTLIVVPVLYNFIFTKRRIKKTSATKVHGADNE